MNTNPPPQSEPNPAKYSRRTFIKSGTVAAAGLSLGDLAFAAPQTETLALAGGAKTVD